MTYIDRIILRAARLFVPSGWELIEHEPEIEARNDGDGTGRIAFGFYLRQVATPPQPPIDRMYLHRRGDRHE